ncbi:hypothetical protein [Rickettsia endosymbiont of Halotydeus destructor]|uniref:hypothetical protein n=1 Tax=Rickettsia endosymbiont of Halotydeus destructor TaxID=2996754 RepID=UPI003BB1CFCA
MGGFFRKPFKALTGAISRYVPGGKYLTGRETARQKSLYNNDLNIYNNYAAEAQSTIDNLSKQLSESAQKLQSIEQQKHQHGQNSGHLHNQVEQYQRGLQNLEQQKTALGSEANALQIVAPVGDNSTNKISKNRKTNQHEYSSEYIYLAEQQVIAESGYSYFPFFVTR